MVGVDTINMHFPRNIAFKHCIIRACSIPHAHALRLRLLSSNNTVRGEGPCVRKL